MLDGEDEVRRWLDFGEVKSLEAMKLLQPKSSLTFHPVSSLVNNSRNNSPECLQPVDPTIKKVKLLACLIKNKKTLFTLVYLIHNTSLKNFNLVIFFFFFF